MIKPSDLGGGPETTTGLRIDPIFEHTPVILIADDDPSIRLVLRHSMEQCGYHVIEASTGIEAVQLAMEQCPDLILMDAVMPEMDGFRATKEIKKIKNCESVPILMATCLDDDKSISNAFDAGACDYLTKPFNWSVLKHRISRMLHAADAERKIQHIAYHDALTGLPNRMLFMDRVGQAISRAQRESSQFALLFIDIDHFKVINDSLGHASGDHLLNIVSHRLKAVLRQSDTVARLGGDEFTIIVEDLVEAEFVGIVASNILTELEKPTIIDNKKVHISGSIGIALYPQDGDNFGSLLKNADTAMYKAKELGRKTFQFYAHEMSLKAMHRLDMENQLRNALDKEEFVVYYQPKINLKTNTCSGAEALVRWHHPDKGLIQPSDFIPLAEETGLITRLDEWVMMTACAQLKEWQVKNYAIDQMSINISARHFQEGGLVNFCKSLFEKIQIKPESVEVELTESALVKNYENAKNILDTIHNMGIRIALDDFGTGYASMSYLKEFPFDTVKLDRSFVHGIPNDKQNTAIVQAMIQLSDALDLSIVAEGVETEQQRIYLTENNCLYGQGYLWSKPIPAENFEKLLDLKLAPNK